MLKSSQWIVPGDKAERFANRLRRDLNVSTWNYIFLVRNCTFHEMIISDNTERGSTKLTCCSCRKKKRMKRKIYVRKIIMVYPRNSWSEGLWIGWFQENKKSLESSSNFQNWPTPNFSKWAGSPGRVLRFLRRIISRLLPPGSLVLQWLS